MNDEHRSASAKQAAEQDVNKDGLVDFIDVRVQGLGLQSYEVHSVKMIMTFNYQLNVRRCAYISNCALAARFLVALVFTACGRFNHVSVPS